MATPLCLAISPREGETLEAPYQRIGRATTILAPGGIKDTDLTCQAVFNKCIRLFFAL